MIRTKTTLLFLLASALLLILAGCGSDGTQYVASSGYSVYRGSYYGPGYGYYYPPHYYDHHHHPDRPDRPNRPGNPSDGPSIQPIAKPRPPANIGRPRPTPRPMPRPAPRRRTR